MIYFSKFISFINKIIILSKIEQSNMVIQNQINNIFNRVFENL